VIAAEAFYDAQKSDDYAAQFEAGLQLDQAVKRLRKARQKAAAQRGIS
jgi:hypothetical protein